MSDPLPINEEERLNLCIDAMIDEGKTVEDSAASVGCAASADSVTPAPESEKLGHLLELSERLRSARRLVAPSDFHLSSWARLENRLEERNQTLPNHHQARHPQDAGHHADAEHPSAFQRGYHESKNSWPIPPTKPVPISTVRAGSISKGSPAPRRSVFVYAAGLLLIIVVLLASTSTGYASRSIPGELLYPVKIASEQVQLALTPSGMESTNLRSRFANERFQEMKALIEQEKISHLKSTVHSYQEEINQITLVYFASDEISRQDRVKVLYQLTQQLANHDAQLTTLMNSLPKDHPDVSVETVEIIQTETRPLKDFTHKLFSVLRDDIRNNKDLLDDLTEFKSLVTVIAPELFEMTSTPAPSLVATTLKPTPTLAATVEEGESELPTSVTTVRPTPWVTDWATLIPDLTTTPPIDWILTNVPTLAPTYLPTFLPTYFPPDDPGDGDEPPGWDWPDDFPDDGDDGDEPPGWDWPDDFPDDGGDGGDGDEPPGWEWP